MTGSHRFGRYAQDVEQARQALLGAASVALAKDGRLLGSATGKGVLPLLRLLAEHSKEASGAVVADKVVGKAAAMLMADAGVAFVYAELMSEKAHECLRSWDVEHFAQKRVSYIKDRTGQGVCPMEKLSDEFRDCADLRRELERRLLGTESTPSDRSEHLERY